MKERYLSKTPFLTFVYLSKCNIKLPGIFGNSKKRYLWTGLMTTMATMATMMTMTTISKLEGIWGSWRLYKRKLDVVWYLITSKKEVGGCSEWLSPICRYRAALAAKNNIPRADKCGDHSRLPLSRRYLFGVSNLIKLQSLRYCILQVVSPRRGRNNLVSIDYPDDLRERLPHLIVSHTFVELAELDSYNVSCHEQGGSQEFILRATFQK